MDTVAQWLILAATGAVIVLLGNIRYIPRGRVGIVERFGRYSRTLDPGSGILVPFLDRLRPLLDVRERVLSFPPQPVITHDDQVVHPDTAVHFQVTDPKAAMCDVANYVQAIEQLTVTMLRSVIGGLDLERVRSARDWIGVEVRARVDQEACRWGVRINRVEVTAIGPAEPL